MQISLVLKEDEIKLAVKDYIKKTGLSFGEHTPEIALTHKGGKITAAFNIDTNIESVVAAMDSKKTVTTAKPTSTVLSTKAKEPIKEVDTADSTEAVTEPTGLFGKVKAPTEEPKEQVAGEPDSPFKQDTNIFSQPAGQTGIEKVTDTVGTSDTLFPDAADSDNENGEDVV